MTSFKKKFDNKRNKYTGKFKEVAGKVTGNEQLELQGKIQTKKAEFKENMYGVTDKIEEIKGSIAEKINDAIDGKHHKKHVL